MAEKWLLGIDLGGTTIKMAFVQDNGDIVKKWEIPTNINANGKHIVSDIAASIQRELKTLDESTDKVKGIGMGAPGFIEMKTGFIYQAVNIGLKDYPLKDELEKAVGVPVTIDNDANIAAIGEMWRGAGNGEEDLLLVTLGTGVGGGILANGMIMHGTNGMAGEIGHITAIPSGGVLCGCGKTGCIETIASATGIARLATEGLLKHPKSKLNEVAKTNGEITAKDVAETARLNDELAVEVMENVGFHLGLVLANLCNAINPGKIVIGGGVSSAGEVLLAPVKKSFQKFALKRVAEGAEFVIATLGNDAGVIGGAWLAKQL